MALTANVTLKMRNTAGMRETQGFAVQTGEHIYKHGLTVLEDDGITCDAAANTATTTFLGIAKEGATAAATLVCYTGMEVSITKQSTVTAGLYGALLYCYDDASVTNVATLGPVCGVHRGLDADNSANVWVLLGAMTADTKAS